MATKVKKQISATKEIVTPQSNKNEAASSSATQKAGAKLQSESGEIKKRGRGPMKNSVKSITAVKKTVQMKAKNVRKDLKINPKNIERVLMENGKDLEGKKILLKNDLKEGVKRGRKPRVPKIKVEPGEDPPPVLEPIFPQDNNMEVKKTPKKRGRKPYKLPTLIDVMAIKSEPLEDTVGTSEFSGDPALLEVITPKVRKPRQRKPKVEPGSIDEVMNDLTFLIDTAQIKTDPNQSALELSKLVTPKGKRMTKKQRLEAMKEDLIKKENIENSVRKLNPAEVKLIESLDLNVAKYKTDFPREKRRHSVEKFPVTPVDSGADGPMIPQLSLFSQMPRSLSPRTSRRVLKMGLKKPSPYSTRSDSSTRLLRNGKHRQLKTFTLLEGLENPTRRRRLQSDFSGCEVPSKMSGYESDSSYSDLASLHGSEKDGDVLKLANKDVDGLSMDESSSFDVKSSVASDPIKAAAGSEVERPLFDTNSNVCDNDSVEIGEHTKLEYIDSNAPLEETSSTKVPDKGILLDIMKHAFSDIELESGLAKDEDSKLHIRASSSAPNVEMKLCAISTNDLSPTATATNLPQSGPSEGLSEEEALIRLLNETAPELSDTGVKHNNTGNKATKDDTIEDVFSANIVNDSTSLLSFPKHSTPKIVLSEQAPILVREISPQNVDKEGVIPVIDNMAVADLEPQQNAKHLEPPLLESSVPLLEPPVVKSASKIDAKTPLIDDKKIGIAVTEKDNVVLFSIEHLTDDSGDLDVSMEDISQNIEEGHSAMPQNTSGAEAAIKETEYVEHESEEVDQPGAKNEESQVDETKTIEKSVEIENESIDIEISEPSQVAEQATGVEASEVPVNEGQLEVKQSEKSVETDVHMTENECDKPSETIEKSDETVDNSKAVENVVQESPEELAQKTSILNALGLQSLHAHAVVIEAGPGPSSGRKKGKASTAKSDGYTGTLKTVIKINKRKGKSSFKMTVQKNKTKSDAAPEDGDDAYKVLKEAGPSCSKYNKDSSDTTGAHRKSHYPNRSNMDGSSEHTSDSEQANSTPDKNQPEKSLIVPEKASSFSIHPGRLCKDECSYCFGKFGLFDTPCHIAQMKSVERQNKILATETHLTWDSCLCDACYRHVDRKSNSPSYMNKSQKRNALVAPGPRQNHCYVLGCNNVSTNILRRKWIIKMRTSICQVINLDLDNPGLHSIPICDEHFTALEHLMICAMCKRRLARNHIHYLGPEVRELNQALKDDAIPVALSDKPVVCKMCKCFASILLKDPEERMENSISFFKDYKKRLVHFNSKEPPDANVPLEPIAIPGKTEKSTDKKKSESRKRKRVRNSSNETNSQKGSHDEKDDDDEMNLRTKKRVPSSDTNNSQSANQSRAQSPDDGDDYGGVDYNTLIPAIAMDCPSDSESKKDGFNNSDGLESTLSTFESMGRSVNISAYKSGEDTSRCNDLAAQKLVQNPSISLKPNYTAINNELWRTGPSSKLISNPALSVRQLFPGEEELGLVGDIDFQNVSTRTPEGWEKSVATIQYDADTKILWQELQKPYGSMSSFLRHLVLLEKYFRNGDLVLSPSASHHAVNYRESVHNRLRAYDNIPSNSTHGPPSSVLQFNKMSMKTSGGGITNQNQTNGLPPVTISQIGRFNENFNSRTPITLQQLNQPPLYPTNVVLQNIAASKSRPPGLISINQRAPAPTTMKTPIPSQKIKFPITKNWRPNLIPINSSKKGEKKPGLIQVVSGGKPYHITIEDYKKMCAIKRSFEAKQKRLLQEQQFAKQVPQKQQAMLVNPHSVLKTFTAKKELGVGKSSTGTVSETKPISLIPISNTAPSTVTSGNGNSETILEKLDKQVERLSKEFAPAKISGIIFEKNPAIQIIPKIPKSLTVIPQTVSKASSSRAVLHVIKSNSNGSSNEEDSNSQP
ncbi:uncharacterized protein LOC109533983 isoform X2 [Dendroctonus ponderosae]|uniref:uncharacterized protein LOC109533983 isoform X2 n=1 Tax=Dendroctonus ponderosae TaxID=77166 RepID=UPI002035A0C3|nr:uncharacterized protein LOC109533983 isoform X2 [Dendroctonus ponderosae]